MYYLFFKNTIMKTFFGWIFAMIMAAVIFCVAIILIPMQTKTVETIELTYVFVDDNGNEHNVLGEWIHGAANDWSFLFENEEEKLEETTEASLPNKDYIWWEEDIEKELDDELLEEILEEKVIEEIIDNWELWVDNLESENNIVYDDCITQWNNVIKHGESVLAYQQRKDVPTICNVQRRICEDGELKWSFEQASCKEDIEYEYTRVKVISYNNKKPGELIQNPEYAKNDSAEFDTDGKINQVNESANSYWNNNSNNPISNNNSTELTKTNYSNCMTPWWEVVSHWQFIKSYESPLGFVDNKCSVELRLCLDWDLKWHYSYKTCEHMDITSQDYRAGNDDITEPTPELMIETLVEEDEGGWLFNWIWSLFN